jgi:hypothetical protein
MINTKMSNSKVTNKKSDSDASSTNITVFSKILCKDQFDFHFSCSITYDFDVKTSITLNNGAYLLFLKYIKKELLRCEDFLKHNNARSKYFFVFTLISAIASCTKLLDGDGIFFDCDDEVDDRNFHGFKISHKNALSVKNINPNGPIEFVTLGVLSKEKISIDEYLDAN